MKKLLLILLFSVAVFTCNAQSSQSADELFTSANNRLKNKWEHIDSTEFVKSIGEYTEAIKQNPEFWQAYRNRARIYYHLKQYENALTDLSKALQYADRSSLPELFEIRGNVFYDMGHFMDAVNDLSVTLENTKQADLLLIRAKAKYKLGKTELACEDFSSARQMDKSLNEKELAICD
ncbi:MAG: tetratricopeptide repeat protein [Cytophagaceae bacterium]|nr:tetratricopeptide repeat protein [Cytophagaceae bacterium]